MKFETKMGKNTVAKLINLNAVKSFQPISGDKFSKCSGGACPQNPQKYSDPPLKISCETPFVRFGTSILDSNESTGSLSNYSLKSRPSEPILLDTINKT